VLFDMVGLQPETRVSGKGIFFIFFACNPLKRLDSEKFMKTNESYFTFIDLHRLAFIWADFAPRLYRAPRPGRGR
jgi:hypothetical protein